MEIIDENESIYSDCDSGSDSDEEFTMKPLRKAMKLIRQELDGTILTMVSVKESLEKKSKKSKQSVKDILNNTLLQNAMDSEVKGIDIYDFIIKTI